MELLLNRKRGRPRKPIQENDYSNDSGDEYNTGGGNRRKTIMSEDARERHRASNRLVAQRARAKAKAETEHLRSEVIIMTAQLEILQSALRQSVSTTEFSTILAHCEEQRTIHAMKTMEDIQDDEEDGVVVSRTSSSSLPRMHTNPTLSRSHPSTLPLPPPATKYPTTTLPPPSLKPTESVVVTSSDIHQQHPLTQQQIQQLHHMHMLQQMVEMQQQLVQTHQPPSQSSSTTTLYHNNFGQFPFISCNLAAAAAAASQANSSSSGAKPHTQTSPTLSLLPLPSQSQGYSSSNGSERSYSSTSSNQTTLSMATDITTLTDQEGHSMIDDNPTKKHRGSNLENESPRTVEDDAEMVFTALTHMRSEILKNSTKDH